MSTATQSSNFHFVIKIANICHQKSRSKSGSQDTSKLRGKWDWGQKENKFSLSSHVYWLGFLDVALSPQVRNFPRFFLETINSVSNQLKVLKIILVHTFMNHELKNYSSNRQQMQMVHELQALEVVTRCSRSHLIQRNNNSSCDMWIDATSFISLSKVPHGPK